MMFKKLNLLYLLLCSVFLALGSCKSQPSPDTGASGASAAQAQAQAADALRKLNEQVGQPNAPPAPVQQPKETIPQKQQPAVNHSKSKPAWVENVDSIYDNSRYVAAVGNASTRDMAEKNALANLAAVFGQSIKADQTITNTYQEAVRNGVTSTWTDNISMQNTINTTASMDTLIGAEVKEVWYDSGSTHYAVAVMENARTAQIYTDMIKANQNMIANLVNMKDNEKNSLEGFSRYQFAAAVADINVAYGNVLQVIGAPVPAGVVKGDNYRLEAKNITKSIPIGIVVKNDKSGRIQGAFAKALSDAGFRSGGNNSRYILDVDITISPVEYPNNTNKFARIELGANLTDTSVKSVLLPYNFNTREGHTTAAEAENRAYVAAERKISEEYKNILSDYLNQLLPKK
jgi:hypothetical protein